MKMSEPVYGNVTADGTRDKDRHNERKETPQHTGSDCVKSRSSRAAAVCLVLLCVLLLTAVIVLSVHIHTKSTNYTEERKELLTRITNLTEDRDQLINKLSCFCKEDEWICYQSSVYYMSSERKNWAESRQDCQKRGADLIIINNKQEQDFVKKITAKREFWIGVTDIDEEDSWKWVDGSTLTSGFWASSGQITEPNGGREENCVVTYLEKNPELIGWLDVTCNGAYQWVCEKRMVTV